MMVIDNKIFFPENKNVKIDRLLEFTVESGAEKLEKVNNEWRMTWDESKPIAVSLVKSMIDSIKIEPNIHKGYVHPPSYRHHLGRIAYFVKNPSEIQSVSVWQDTRYVELKDEPVLFINDGYHRLMAALVLNWDSINIDFYGLPIVLEHLASD